jgi:hypothetical protein
VATGQQVSAAHCPFDPFLLVIVVISFVIMKQTTRAKHMATILGDLRVHPGSSKTAVYSRTMFGQYRRFLEVMESLEVRGWVVSPDPTGTHGQRWNLSPRMLDTLEAGESAFKLSYDVLTGVITAVTD